MNKLKFVDTIKATIAAVLFIFFVGCASINAEDSGKNEALVSALIIGSTEHPDPVLARVMELEKKGVLKNVIVRESFPVQISATGPKNIIEELQAMPRKKLEGFQ